MDWKTRLQVWTDGTLATGDLHERVRRLLAYQCLEWEGLREGIQALSKAETRLVHTRGGSVIVQHNSQRIASTSAIVDDQSILRRPCFLCPENMPDQERGIDFLGRYAIVCNPYPVLPSHLIIASKQHRPQRIRDHVSDLLELSRALGAEFAVFYNGPRCGASAPDHLHFQAAEKHRLPLIDDFKNIQSNIWHYTNSGSISLRFHTLAEYRINLLIAESRDAVELASWFDRCLHALGLFTVENDPEPMLNLMIDYDGLYRIAIFPRDRHRPSAFFAEGAAHLTISPAAIDLAGVLVVPVAADFQLIDAARIEEIFAEVTISNVRFSDFCGYFLNERRDD